MRPKSSHHQKLALKSHTKDFSPHELLLHSSLLPAALQDTAKDGKDVSKDTRDATETVPFIVLIKQAPHLQLYIRLTQTHPIKGVPSLSLSHELLSSTPLQPMKPVSLSYASVEDAALDYIRVSFREQFLSRSDMYPFMRHMQWQTAYLNKRLEYRGMRLTIRQLMKNQREVTSGLITPQTKITFRTQSAVIYMMVEMSREMWEYAGDGDIYWEKALAFCEQLWHGWDGMGARHVLQVVLFGRYEVLGAEESGAEQQGASSPQAPSFRTRLNDALKQLLGDTPSTCFQLNSQMTCIDFFTLIDAHHVTYKNPASLAAMIKHKFMEYHNNIQQLAQKLSQKMQMPLELSIVQAPDSNFLEALNLVLIAYQSHNVNRDLHHTGQYFIVLSAGVGVYNIYSTALSTISKKRIGDNGIGVDMICLSYPPLHHVPLFKYVHKQLGGENLYRSPDWLALYFYDQKTYKQEGGRAGAEINANGGTTVTNGGSISSGVSPPATSTDSSTATSPTALSLSTAPEYYQLPKSDKFIPTCRMPSLLDRPFIPDTAQSNSIPLPEFRKMPRTTLATQVDFEMHDEKVFDLSRDNERQIVNSISMETIGDGVRRPASFVVHHSHSYGKKAAMLMRSESDAGANGAAQGRAKRRRKRRSHTITQADLGYHHHHTDGEKDEILAKESGATKHPDKRKHHESDFAQASYRSAHRHHYDETSHHRTDFDVPHSTSANTRHNNQNLTILASSPLSAHSHFSSRHQARSHGGHSHSDRFLMPSGQSPVMRRFMFKLFNPFQNTIQNPMTVHLEAPKKPSLHQKRWSHLFPSENASKQIKRSKSTALRPNWLSLVEPACLPMTTNYWPDAVTLSKYNQNNSHFLADEHYTTHSLMLELICQRLHQGYQIYQPSSELQSSNTNTTHFYLSMSQQFHEVYIDSYNSDSVTVKRYIKKTRGEQQLQQVQGPRTPQKVSSTLGGTTTEVSSTASPVSSAHHPDAPQSEHNSTHDSSDSETESDDSFPYKYLMWNPLLKSFQNRETWFKNIPPDEYKWNLLDNIVCGYLDDLPQHLATRCLQYHLVPCNNAHPSSSMTPMTAGSARSSGTSPSIFSTHKNQHLQQFAKFLQSMTSRVFKSCDGEPEHLDVQLIEPSSFVAGEITDTHNKLLSRKIGTTRIKLENSGERYEWIYLTTKDSYFPEECFFFQIHWLVCSAVTIDHYIQALIRKAKQCGFEMYATPIDSSWRSYSTPFRVYARLALPEQNENKVKVFQALIEHPFFFHSELLPISVHSKRFVNGDGTVVIHSDAHHLWWLENPLSVNHTPEGSSEQVEMLNELKELIEMLRANEKRESHIEEEAMVEERVGIRETVVEEKGAVEE